MRIVVFARPVQNPAVPVAPAAVRGVEELPGYAPIPNPMDELALELALRLREQADPPAALLACSVGGEPGRSVLLEFLACGAEEGVCIEERCWEPDGGVVARRLSEFYRVEPFDLGLFGARDMDTGAGEVGPMFAALTGLPYIESVIEARWSGNRQLDIVRKRKRLREEIRVTLPACLGILRGAPLRYPSFWGKIAVEESRIRSVPRREIPLKPRIERKKFTRSKPKKSSIANAYAESSSVDRMRQALGIAGAGGKQKEDAFFKGDPEEVADRIITILKKNKMIDPPSP